MMPAAFARLFDMLREECPHELGDLIAVRFQAGQKECSTKDELFSEWEL